MRKKITAILVMLAMVLAMPSWAAEKKSAGKKEDICAALEASVREQVSQLNKCWSDEDCRPVYLGCPWQQYTCEWSAVGQNDTEKDARGKLKQDMEKFQAVCVAQREALQNQCAMFAQKEENISCPEPKLLCISGKCVTETHVLMHGEGEGTDIYGSRSVYGIRPDMPKPEAGKGKPE